MIIQWLRFIKPSIWLSACALIAVCWAYDRAAQYHKGAADKAAETAAVIAAKEAQMRRLSDAAAARFQKNEAVRLEKEKVRREVVEKIINRPVYVNRCLDAGGVRELNAAIDGD